MNNTFNLKEFLPYLLNRAAEHSSAEFQDIYKRKYGMLRTEWRVLFHLGHYGEMTAKEICDRSGLHKTKVSRAVAKLEAKRFIKRTRQQQDRRFETLVLSKQGNEVYLDLKASAQVFQQSLTSGFTEKETRFLIAALEKLNKSRN